MPMSIRGTLEATYSVSPAQPAGSTQMQHNLHSQQRLLQCARACWLQPWCRHT